MHDVPRSQAPIHRWAPWYTVSWTFYYISDPANIPPYFPIPQGNFTTTLGRTYFDDTTSHGRCMREVYDSRCIPIFFDDVLSINNNYSCDFLNIGDTQTAYLILHDDRPKGAPECCIIGQPFHPPPRNFSDNLYIKKASTIEVRHCILISQVVISISRASISIGMGLHWKMLVYFSMVFIIKQRQFLMIPLLLRVPMYST